MSSELKEVEKNQHGTEKVKLEPFMSGILESLIEKRESHNNHAASLKQQLLQQMELAKREQVKVVNYLFQCARDLGISSVDDYDFNADTQEFVKKGE